MLSNDQIITQVEAAFEPLRCVAEIWDYGEKLRFKIFDINGNDLHEVKYIVLRDVRNSVNLNIVVENARDKISNRG